jgi:hypothetical protein
MSPYPINLLCLYHDNPEALGMFDIRKDRVNIRVRICVRLLFQNVPKPTKIGKSVELENLVFKACYDKLRNVGNPKAVPENPRVGSSILSLGTREINGLQLLGL